MSVAATPDAALMRWVTSVPAIRCAPAAFRPWTGTHEASTVPITATSNERFGKAGFSGAVIAGMTHVAGSGTRETYWAARVPAAHALVLSSGSDALEESFTAVIGAAPSAPPMPLVPIPAAPRAHGLGLGSTRADVERILGPGHAKSACGYDIVRYEPSPGVISVAEMWFFYTGGRVVALARYEAV